MTRVFGRLFPDGRDGILALTPSRPFLGAEGGEEHYEVIDGGIDIELLPTPRGICYNVGFKRVGDMRRSIYTARWTVPNSGELDVTPKSTADAESNPITPKVFERAHTKRLASELHDAITDVDNKHKELVESRRREDALLQELEQFKQTTDTLIRENNRQLNELQEQVSSSAEIKTVVKKVSVLPAPLEERINRLEAENIRLHKLNERYYQAVIELNQLKLERAQTEKLPDPIIEVPGTPQQRLIQKLLAK